MISCSLRIETHFADIWDKKFNAPDLSQNHITSSEFNTDSISMVVESRKLILKINIINPIGKPQISLMAVGG